MLPGEEATNVLQTGSFYPPPNLPQEQFRNQKCPFRAPGSHWWSFGRCQAGGVHVKGGAWREHTPKVDKAAVCVRGRFSDQGQEEDPARSRSAPPTWLDASAAPGQDPPFRSSSSFALERGLVSIETNPPSLLLTLARSVVFRIDLTLDLKLLNAHDFRSKSE